MIDKKSIEEISVGSFEAGEVQVFVDIRRTGIDHTHRTHDLGISSFDNMWD